jgi:hypothetical protein
MKEPGAWSLESGAVDPGSRLQTPCSYRFSNALTPSAIPQLPL